MQKQTKQNILQLLTSITNAHKKLDKTGIDARISLLEGCQEAAIVVGETIEKELSESSEIVSLLESYCEMIFEVSQKSVVHESDRGKLDDQISRVRALINGLETKYRVVFLPYKAEMWDSLESIWMACREDDRCECAVVPIPYFEYNSKKKEWEYRYDGEKFPDYVPVVPYREYPIEQNCPELAYVHNPYDNCNYVTSVYPDYYSYELKKYVQKLVYVPYYVTPGWISMDHLQLSVYNHMDYMIAQSGYAKECCTGMPYYHKIMPFGSPKFDKVIRKCKNGVDIPEAWKEILSGKKVLLINVSIGDLLNYGAILFKKLVYLFQIIQGQERVALIWRPHPLLKATIRSMRPQLLGEYEKLLEYFQEAKIGVLDNTPDISDTIAIADGYAEFGFSSVANLVGVTGKPIFIMDPVWYEDVAEPQKRSLQLYDMTMYNDRLYFTTDYNALVYMDLVSREFHLAEGSCESVKWSKMYSYLAGTWDKLYLSPLLAVQPVTYRLDNGQFESLFYGKQDNSLQFGEVIVCGQKVCYLPAKELLMMVYDSGSGEWSYYSDCISDLWEGLERSSWMRPVHHAAVYDKSIWITTAYNNRILRFCPDDGSYQIYKVGGEKRGYTGIIVDEAGLWLADMYSGDLVRWEKTSDSCESYPAPKEFGMWKCFRGFFCAHLNLYECGDYLVTTPAWADAMLKFDKRTKEMRLLVPEFWRKTPYKTNGYDPEMLMLDNLINGRIDDAHLLVQRNTDRMAAIVDVVNETYEEFPAAFCEGDYQKFIAGSDGFEKACKRAGFYRKENAVFPLKSFVQELAEGKLDSVKKRQLAELSTLAANLDGTCGERVHRYMMDVLDAGQR